MQVNGQKQMISENIVSTELFRIFKKYQSKQFVFVEPGGNWGDYLIYMGAYKLAKLCGIIFEIKHISVFFLRRRLNGCQGPGRQTLSLLDKMWFLSEKDRLK